MPCPSPTPSHFEAADRTTPSPQVKGHEQQPPRPNGHTRRAHRRAHRSDPVGPLNQLPQPSSPQQLQSSCGPACVSVSPRFPRAGPGPSPWGAWVVVCPFGRSIFSAIASAGPVATLRQPHGRWGESRPCTMPPRRGKQQLLRAPAAVGPCGDAGACPGHDHVR